MPVDDFPKGPAQFGQVELFAGFRCSCGKLAAMGDQPGPPEPSEAMGWEPNGDAAMVHETPYCERFEAVRSMREGIAYYQSLEPVALTPELLRQIERNQAHA